MKDRYDFSKGFRRPELAERLRKNGYKIRVTEGDDEKVVDEYFVSPEEVEAYDKRRKNRRIQN